MTMVQPPLNMAQLNERLVDAAGDLAIPVARARVMLCTLIVAQMLPNAVMIKGGMGVKLRLGERGTRATADLDISSRARGGEFEHEFKARLAQGWGAVPASKGARRNDPNAPDRVAFTATVRAIDPHDPGLVLPEYVMHPYRVSISFLGRQWAALDVELSDPEIDSYTQSQTEIDDELVQFAARFGFGALQPVALVSLEYQIAQKIHAVTDPTYERAHDLVDLQLLWNVGPDLSILRDMCARTFDWRQQQPWPPFPLRPMESWALAYSDARVETIVGGETSILPDVQVARVWLERAIESVESSKPDQ